jgi:toluene monooxygenase system protein E
MPKTYWHLESLKRKPSEYDVATSRLLYYVERGFEVRVPVEEWYRRYQRSSPLSVADWEAFRDPRETTYTRYTERQKTKEIFVDGLLEAIEATGYDRELSAGWLRILDRVLAPLRFPVHGLQMIAAYVGQMAPAGRIAIAALFQAADEMRRTQRLAYRMRQLQEVHPAFGQDSRAVWQNDPVWQPWRRVIEELLVTYDWGEALVALNLVVKPAFDELFMTSFGRLALSQGDDVLGKVFLSLNEDCAWHREWSRALVGHAWTSRPDNAGVIEGWVAQWCPRVDRAVAALAPVFDEMPERPTSGTFAAALAHIEATGRQHRASVGVKRKDEEARNA